MSFNQDKPYDRFILEQLAADKLNLGQDKRALAGLGFLTVGDRFNGNRNDMINDQIDVVTKGFLGLTVTCARCHDHKFDPIPQKDYYSLHGIFNSTTQPKEDPIIANEGDAKEYEQYVKDREAALNSAKQFAADEIERLRQQFRAERRSVFARGAGAADRSSEIPARHRWSAAGETGSDAGSRARREFHAPQPNLWAVRALCGVAGGEFRGQSEGARRGNGLRLASGVFRPIRLSWPRLR